LLDADFILERNGLLGQRNVLLGQRNWVCVMSRRCDM
jgi:hypothetical protein